MKFKDISIRNKIILIFVAIIISVASLVTFIVKQVDSVRDALVVFTDTTVPSVLLVKDMQITLEEIRRDQYALVANPNHELVPIWQQNMHDYEKRVVASLDNYREGLWDARDRAAFANLEQYWQVYREQLSLFRQAFMQGDIYQANHLTVQGYNEYQDAFKAMAGLEKLNQIYMSEDTLTADERVKHTSIVSFIGMAAVIIFLIGIGVLLVKQIRAPLQSIMALTSHIINGDLTYKIDRQKLGSDEFGQLADTCQTMQQELQQLVEKIASAAVQLASSIDEVSAVSEQTSQGMLQQQSQLAMVATAMNQLQATVNEVASNTEEASCAANNASTTTRQGAGGVSEAMSQIVVAQQVIEDAGMLVAQLEKDSNDINMVVDVIKNIAEQTNLLALNAAIEAARAGEQGRGFAVVADEVRTLAGRTQSSTEEIVRIIEKLQQRAKKAVDATTQSCETIGTCNAQASTVGGILDGIGNSIDNIANMNIQIASACSEQSSVSEELQRNVDHIHCSSIEVATGSAQTAQACIELSQLAANMRNIILQFKVV
ncbi:methyl-accepting chemotaxis protein [Vibrio scophthalmi]|uniref:Methyl-accepting chemotaxis protein n=1 Tax=Vibrio scophthalmi LMG 19158 TaxID=870967 RepID=F9RPX3_9VIBR|nr:methyl-accepting chemotaxis protein [Vibrio scophthalmi]EGU35020.1 methyl-accepting chemotaxis protein [Vibrio scophthalmi LMG 19158]